MTQSRQPETAARSAASPELNALLEALQNEQRAAGTAPASASAGSGHATSDRSTADLTARRVQALIRAFDVLHRQVASIAAQGDTINKVADAQNRSEKAINELQRNLRYLRALTIQQVQQQAAPAVLPPLQIKLMIGHIVDQQQQAAADAALLLQWAGLFVGVAVGLSIATAVTASFARDIAILFGAIAAVTSIVGLIFWTLSRSARQRAAAARRAMDESTLVRTISHALDTEA